MTATEEVVCDTLTHKHTHTHTHTLTDTGLVILTESDPVRTATEEVFGDRHTDLASLTSSNTQGI